MNINLLELDTLGKLSLICLFGCPSHSTWNHPGWQDFSIQKSHNKVKGM